MQAGKHSHPYTIDGKCAEAKRSRSTAVEGALGTPTERRGGGGGGGGGGGPEEEEEGWGVRRRSRLLLQARELNKDRPSRHSRVWAFRHCSSTGPTSDPRPVGGRSGGVTAAKELQSGRRAGAGAARELCRSPRPAALALPRGRPPRARAQLATPPTPPPGRLLWTSCASSRVGRQFILYRPSPADSRRAAGTSRRPPRAPEARLTKLGGFRAS
ncbi:unnamed protein product [Prorocentrum cordatum]|uniref:Uncharacterized protein n=1 Tax=Prorocentrum cordatum TaxID=2364126 RepID=A0ABN9Q5N6_9DINO|nr:unnamed protein product [Polarella glacialis]